MQTVTTIRKSWSHLDSRFKKALYVWLAGFAVNMLYETYNGGKTELLRFREEEESKIHTPRRHAGDWQAAYYGCRQDKMARFTNSVAWPVTIVGNTMPSVLLLLNPRKEKKDSVVAAAAASAKTVTKPVSAKASASS
jgi:hypothetical protein